MEKISEESLKASGGLRTRNILKSSKENNPLISIITVVKNNKQYVEKNLGELIKSQDLSKFIL